MLKLLSAPTCYKRVILAPPPAPCTLAAAWRGAGATVALPAALCWQWLLLAMVVFGGVARASLVPPTGPAVGWPGCHPPCSALSARLCLTSAGSRLPGMPLLLGSRHSRQRAAWKLEGVPACRECLGGRVARASVGPARPIVAPPLHSPDPPHHKKIVPTGAHLVEKCRKDETRVSLPDSESCC